MTLLLLGTITRITINPHLNFVKGTVLGDKEQGIRIMDKGQWIRVKG